MMAQDDLNKLKTELISLQIKLQSPNGDGDTQSGSLHPVLSTRAEQLVSQVEIWQAFEAVLERLERIESRLGIKL
jgi:hypothetical protein